MKVTIINATMREEISYNIAKVLSELIAGEDGIIYEVFLPKNLPEFCTGCKECISADERNCPHRSYISAIEAVMENSSVIIFASPVYGYHIPASLKNLFDHFSYRWIHHRPQGSMWNKQGVIITSRSHSTPRHAEKDIAHNLSHWGIAKIHKQSFKSDRLTWEDVRPYDKLLIGKKLEKLAKKILRRIDTPPSLSARVMFFKGKYYQKFRNKNKTDTEYWGILGWLDVIRPWYIKRIRK